MSDISLKTRLIMTKHEILKKSLMIATKNYHDYRDEITKDRFPSQQQTIRLAELKTILLDATVNYNTFIYEN